METRSFAFTSLVDSLGLSVFLGMGGSWRLDFVALIHPLRTVVICTIIGLVCGQISDRVWLLRDEGGIECGWQFFSQQLKALHILTL